MRRAPPAQMWCCTAADVRQMHAAEAGRALRLRIPFTNAPSLESVIRSSWEKRATQALMRQHFIEVHPAASLLTPDSLSAA